MELVLLGTELGSFAKALNHWAISPSPPKIPHLLKRVIFSLGSDQRLLLIPAPVTGHCGLPGAQEHWCTCSKSRCCPAPPPLTETLRPRGRKSVSSTRTVTQPPCLAWAVFDSPTAPNIAAIYMTAKKCFGRSQSGHQNAEAHMFLLTFCQNVVAWIMKTPNFLIQNIKKGNLTQEYIFKLKTTKQKEMSQRYNKNDKWEVIIEIGGWKKCKNG